MADEILKTIIRQLAAQKVDLKNKILIDLKENEGSITKKGLKVYDPRKKRAVSILYNEGRDLYDVQIDETSIGKGKVDHKQKKVQGVFFDQLKDFF